LRLQGAVSSPYRYSNNSWERDSGSGSDQFQVLIGILTICYPIRHGFACWQFQVLIGILTIIRRFPEEWKKKLFQVLIGILTIFSIFWGDSVIFCFKSL